MQLIAGMRMRGLGVSMAVELLMFGMYILGNGTLRVVAMSGNVVA